MKVLLVDREPSFLEDAKRFLKNKKFNVNTASSPKKGLEYLKKDDYDVIVSGPEVTRTEKTSFLNKVKNNNDSISFIAIDDTGGEIGKKMVKSGASQYIEKETYAGEIYLGMVLPRLWEAINKEAKVQLPQKSENMDSSLSKLLLEKIPVPVQVKDREAQYTEISKSMAEHLNADRESIIGKTDLDFYSENVGEEMYGDDKHVIETGEPITNKQMKIRRPDSQKQWISVYKFPLRKNGKIVGLIGTYQDITYQKEIEKKLEAGREKVVFMAEQSMNLMFRIDRNYVCRYANKKTVSFLGVDKEEIVGSKLTNFLSEKDAEEILKPAEKVFKTGEGVELEHTLTDRKKHLYSSFNPIPDPQTGEIINILITSRDISREKKALERQEFLHSLLRHDLRNKIQIIHGYLEFLQGSELTKKQEKFLQKAIQATQNSFNLIEEVRALKKVEQPHEIGEKNIGSLLEEVIEENRTQADEKGIRIDFEKSKVKVKGGPLLKELFVNLLRNSIQHSRGKRVRIRILEEEENITVTVEDNGVGIPKEDWEKVFKKSYSGKESRGSGLGLNLAKKIAENYGGSIELKESELGGVRFDINLKKAN